MSSRVLRLWMLLGCLSCHFAAGADEWSVGIARVRITPQQPLRLAGYASRSQPFERVITELSAKALTIRDADQNTAILITTDLLGLSAQLSEPVIREIADRTGVPASSIVVNSSHTHTGPALRTDGEGVDWPADQIEASVRYTKKLQRQLIDLAVRSFNKRQPARLSRGQGVAPFVMNRREFTERGVRLGVNPRGLADRSVPVLRIQSVSGKVIGVVFGTACHNTTLSGEHNHVSGDFAGYAQEHVEDELNGATAFFVQGCAGDANPFPRGSEEIALHHGETLGREVIRVLDEKLEPVRGPLRTIQRSVALPLRADLTEADIDRLSGSGGWRKWVAQQIRQRQDRDQAMLQHYQTTCSLWQFGDDLTVVFLPGEVVVGYVRLIERAIGPRKLWISAYCNDVFGYLPTARVLVEGGYETRGLYAGGIGFFSPAAEPLVIQTVREMASEAGREVPAPPTTAP